MEWTHQEIIIIDLGRVVVVVVVVTMVAWRGDLTTIIENLQNGKNIAKF